MDLSFPVFMKTSYICVSCVLMYAHVKNMYSLCTCIKVCFLYSTSNHIKSMGARMDLTTTIGAYTCKCTMYPCPHR